MDVTRTPNDRSGGGEGGFTLVELMVVLLVILTLVAVVVPTYRGARERAQDRVAQLNVRAALIAARVIHSDYGGYGPIRDDGTGVLSSVEPTLRYTTDGSQAPDEISVKAGRASSGQSRRGVVQLAVLSETEVCWHIYDDDAIGTFYGHVDLAGLNKTNAAVQREACGVGEADTHLTVGVTLGQDENVVNMQPLTGRQQFRLICFYEDGWQPTYRPRARVEFQNNTCPAPLEP